MTEHRKPTYGAFWTSKRRLFLSVILLLVLIGLAVYWQVSLPGGLQALPERLDDLRLRANSLTVMEVLLIIMIASVIAIPLGLIIVSGTVIFGPWLGAVYVMSGTLIGGIVSFLIGASLGRQIVEELCGPRFKRVSKMLGQRGLLSVIIIRLLPIAPFAIVNMLAGATHLRLRDFVLGTFLGMLPGLVILGVGIDHLLSMVMRVSH